MNDTEIENLVFGRSPKSISTVLDGETVILDVESGVYSGLNDVGTVVWTMLESQVTFAAMRDAILDEFDVSEEECTENLLTFLKELVRNKLIGVTGDTNP